MNQGPWPYTEATRARIRANLAGYRRRAVAPDGLILVGGQATSGAVTSVWKSDLDGDELADAVCVDTSAAIDPLEVAASLRGRAAGCGP